MLDINLICWVAVIKFFSSRRLPLVRLDKILIERKKFKTLGWNVSYDFNDSDYSVCEDLLAIYMGRFGKDSKPLDTYEKKAALPW